MILRGGEGLGIVGHLAGDEEGAAVGFGAGSFFRAIADERPDAACGAAAAGVDGDGEFATREAGGAEHAAAGAGYGGVGLGDFRAIGARFQDDADFGEGDGLLGEALELGEGAEAFGKLGGNLGRVQDRGGGGHGLDSFSFSFS